MHVKTRDWSKVERKKRKREARRDKNGKRRSKAASAMRHRWIRPSSTNQRAVSPRFGPLRQSQNSPRPLVWSSFPPSIITFIKRGVGGQGFVGLVRKPSQNWGKYRMARKKVPIGPRRIVVCRKWKYAGFRTFFHDISDFFVFPGIFKIILILNYIIIKWNYIPSKKCVKFGGFDNHEKGCKSYLKYPRGQKPLNHWMNDSMIASATVCNQPFFGEK